MAVIRKKLKVLLFGRALGAYRTENLVKILIEAGYNISWINPSFYSRKTGGKHFILNFLFRQTNKFLLTIEMICKAPFADVIYLLPLNTYFIDKLLTLKKWFGNKIIAEPYISAFDTKVRDKREAHEKSRVARRLKQKDINVLTKADFIIHMSNYEIEYWEKLLHIEVDRSKVFTAPLFNEAQPYSHILRRRFMQDGTLRICWWGSAFPLHGLDNVIEAMRILMKEKIGFTLNLFGVNNKYFERYEKLISSDSSLSQNIFVRKDLKFSDQSLPEYLVDNCDLVLGIFGNSEKARAGTPNKVLEALSLAIPTLTMHSPAIREFFDPDTDLWTCQPNAGSIADAVKAIVCGNAYPVDWETTSKKVQSTFSLARYREVVTGVLNRIHEDLERRQITI